MGQTQTASRSSNVATVFAVGVSTKGSRKVSIDRHRAESKPRVIITKSEIPSRHPAFRGRVLVVEDEAMVREALAPILEAAGYEVTFAHNGRDALERLHDDSRPDIILLDLLMPVMNGWEFRAIQKDDPKLGLIPVVALSADGSAQAAAISAQAYLRKPIVAAALLSTIERVIRENVRQLSERVEATERLAAMGRIAAGVGHEINNPLAFIMLNLANSLNALRPALAPRETALTAAAELTEIKARVADVIGMLEESEVGSERIRSTVINLQRLSRQDADQQGPVDVNELLEQSVSMVWNQIRHHARLSKTLGVVPSIAHRDHDGRRFHGWRSRVHVTRTFPSPSLFLNYDGLQRFSGIVVHGTMPKSVHDEIKEGGIPLKETRAASEEQRLASFIEALRVAVFVTDAKGKPCYSNELSRELLGKGLVSDAGPDDLSHVYQAFSRRHRRILPSRPNALGASLGRHQLHGRRHGDSAVRTANSNRSS